MRYAHMDEKIATEHPKPDITILYGAQIERNAKRRLLTVVLLSVGLGGFFLLFPALAVSDFNEAGPVIWFSFGPGLF
jgi:hypothetical protein